MKGIILAGGTGSRLFPLTISTSKQLLPVYDKPMIFYSLTTLINFNIKEVLIICKKNDIDNFKKLIGSGEEFGIIIKYAFQEKPRGIAESFIIAEKFINTDNVMLILGDNIFHGLDYNLSNYKLNSSKLFLYHVPDAQNYGVAMLSGKKIIKIIEKPKIPKSNLIVTGLYIYDNDVIKISKNLVPSQRGELEITDVNNVYLKRKKLNFEIIKDGAMWLDAGTPESLFQASQYVKIIQERQQILIGSPHYAAYRKKFITKQSLKKIINNFSNTFYENKLKLLCNIK